LSPLAAPEGVAEEVEPSPAALAAGCVAALAAGCAEVSSPLGPKGLTRPPGSVAGASAGAAAPEAAGLSAAASAGLAAALLAGWPEASSSLGPKGLGRPPGSVEASPSGASPSPLGFCALCSTRTFSPASWRSCTLRRSARLRLSSTLSWLPGCNSPPLAGLPETAGSGAPAACSVETSSCMPCSKRFCALEASCGGGDSLGRSLGKKEMPCATSPLPVGKLPFSATANTSGTLPRKRTLK